MQTEASVSAGCRAGARGVGLPEFKFYSDLATVVKLCNKDRLPGTILVSFAAAARLVF
jgi:hypothetical protein